MIKTPPSPLRLAGLIGFVLACVLVLTYLWISFGGSIPFAAQGYRIEVAFPQANELAGGADVRIAGVDVGTVVGLKVDRQDSRTLATLQIERRYAPIPTNTRATLRIKTLLGETYVELSSGNRSGPDLPDGGRLADGQVQPDVALDQILSTFDPATRKAFETWMQDQAGAVVGRGADINASFGTLPDFVDSGESLLSTLNAQSASVRGLVANTGEFFNAISARRGQLSGLITAANGLFATTARRNQDLADVFKALPEFELQSRLTLPALTAFAHKADPVVRALDPIAPQLTQSFGLADQLSPQLRQLFERLGPTITASKRGLPALDNVLHELPPLLQAFGPFLRNADPIVEYIGLFKPEITGFFGNVTAASQGFNHEAPFAPGAGDPLRAGVADADPLDAGVLRARARHRPQRRVPLTGRLQPAQVRARHAQHRAVLRGQPRPADERDRLDPADGERHRPEPSEHRPAGPADGVPHHGPGHRRAAVQGPGQDPGLLDAVPAPRGRSAAEPRSEPLSSASDLVGAEDRLL